MSTPLSQEYRERDEALTVDQLRADLFRRYKDDPRLQPFVALLDAVEAPEVDYDSPQVETIIHDLKTLNRELIPLKARKTHLVRPFFDPTRENGEEMKTADAALAAKADQSGEGLQKVAHAFSHDVSPNTTTFIDADVEEVVTEAPFSNWGKTVQFTAGHTLVVRTVKGVQAVVRWAAQQSNKPKVRVAGFRHSWSDLFGADGDIIIMFLPFDTLTKIPYKAPDPSWRSELTGKHAIQLVNTVAGRSPPPGHAFCKVMAGVTNDQFREWSFANQSVCIPFNVIMVEITFGGSNAPVCHGSGFSSTTLSDLVKEVTYVDAKGELQTINDKTELMAASGCFGLLGVVVCLTLQLDQMGITEMMPVKLPLPLAIPPPPGYKVPWEVKLMMLARGIDAEDLEKAQRDFITRCENDYYLEWFWFPYQLDCWVNTWSKRAPTSRDTNIKAYPEADGIKGVKSQQIQGALAEQISNCPLFQAFDGRLQAFVLGLGAMLALPDAKYPEDAIKTYVSEALHFRRGIQNFRALDTEWEIPFTTTNGRRNYEDVQRAWWDGITAIYSREDAPVRVALEMRLTGGSDVLLAPQRGNTAGTISIEVLSTLMTPPESWRSCMQLMADKWAGYDLRDERGRVLYPRPHWAKQWAGLTVHGKDIKTYFKEDAYRYAFAEFRDTFAQIVAKRGSSVEETLGMFGNKMMRELIFE